MPQISWLFPKVLRLPELVPFPSSETFCPLRDPATCPAPIPSIHTTRGPQIRGPGGGLTLGW